MNINQFLDRPIAFHRAFVNLGVGVAGALMLSQSLYWSKRTGDNKGWFYKTQADWEDETGMTRSEQEKARRALKSIGVLHEIRKGIPAKLYFKVDTEKLESLLYGTIEAVPIDVVIENYSATISKLSKAGYMRAIKAGVKADNVDYVEVLKSKGMVCGICKKQIKLGPGRTKESLSFDHIKPICKGGDHVLDNIQPSHFSCNSAKSGNDVLTDDSSMLIQSKQDCFDESHSCEPTKQTNTETTQRLPETTTEIIADKSTKPSKRSKTKRSFPDDFKPTEQHKKLANDLNVNLQHEFYQFADHHKAKGSKFADWHAALRTWIRNSAKFSKSKQPARAGYIRNEQVDYSKGINDDGTF